MLTFLIAIGPMLTFLIAILAAIFLWEAAILKVNLRLAPSTRKKLFRTGARFALVALVMEFAETLIPNGSASLAASTAMHALLASALPEEFLKFIAVSRFGKKELNETGPGLAVLLAVGTSLGFGVLESQFSGGYGGFGQWALHALTTLPMDAVFGFTMGGFMAMAWRDPEKLNEKFYLLSLLVPLSFHFLFSFLLAFHQSAPQLLWPLAALAVTILLEGTFALILANHAINHPQAFHAQRNLVDPAGRRTMQLAILSAALAIAALLVSLRSADFHEMSLCAVLPLLFALDLGMTALSRSRRYA